MTTAYNQTQEVNEAILAGKHALQSLFRAQEMLDKARTWGIFDIFGGNIITGLLKHSRLQEAGRYLEEARRDLAYFQQELRDVEAPEFSSIAGDFLTAGDFLFDGFIMDFLVQAKINDARARCAEAIRRTQELLLRLRQYQ